MMGEELRPSNGPGDRYVGAMVTSPEISVVMPARNVAPYIDTAVESILRQSFRSFELIIRDDGSTDGTSARLREWARQDPRIRLFEGDQLGLAGSSNWVVQQARAPLIARMDGDDVARYDRLERQLEVLRRDPTILLVGSLADSIGADGIRIRGMDRSRITRRSWFAPFPHTSIMFRSDAFHRVGGYRSLPYCEDWDLFLRIANEGPIAVIADSLVSHRVVATSASGAPEHQRAVQYALDQMLQAIPSRGSGEPYRPICLGDSAVALPRRIDPMAIVSSNSTQFWAGGSPRVLRELLHRGRLRFDGATLGAIGWAVLAQLAPNLLRRILKALLFTRDMSARLQVRRGRAYLWKPGQSLLKGDTAYHVRSDHDRARRRRSQPAGA